MSAHDAVTAVLVYLAIGSLVWVGLYSAGVIQETCSNRQHTRLAIVLASIGVFLAWPAFVWVAFIQLLMRFIEVFEERCR